VPGGLGFVDFDTLSLTTVPGTVICGRIFASELVDAGMTGAPMNEALEGVTLTVEGRDDLVAVTDALGNFRLDPAPAGPFFLLIDGKTATNPVATGAYYPTLGKPFESSPGREITVGDIFLPLIREGTLQQVSNSDPTPISLPPAVLADFPELAGAQIIVPANSLYADDGTRGGSVGIAPVDPARLPGALPDGLDFPIVITVQTDGATNFDEPVPICLPNLPDPETGLPLAAGGKTALWSFDHDEGRFHVVGSMTVSGDGQLVCSDPGVGILEPGWHGTQAGTEGGGGEIVDDED
jgi:hypothetical protein